MPVQQLRFEQRANSYVIIPAAAATLLALLFVVITLLLRVRCVAARQFYCGTADLLRANRQDRLLPLLRKWRSGYAVDQCYSYCDD